jgi:class 3 adenylate cyclase
MAVFGAPVAFGDDAKRAVRAAFAVREAVAELNAVRASPACRAKSSTGSSTS